MIATLTLQGYPLTAKYYHGIRGLASKLSFKYGKSCQEEDFIQIALSTACRAEKRYDSYAGASFYTYINKIIKNDIQKSFGNINRNTKDYKTIQKFIDDFGRTNTRYPEVQEISIGTGLSRFEILSIYYDKYREQSLENNMDEGLMSDPFVNTDHSWITEHLDCLDDTERYLLSSLYTYELPMADAASALDLTVSQAKSIHTNALAKVKESIKRYQ